MDRITRLTALLVLPWTIKFLWASAIELLRRRGFSYRGWAIGAQVAMALALVPLMILDPAQHLLLIVAAWFAHSVAAATQDVAIDGLAIQTTPEGMRGGLNAWMQAGLLLRRSLFGGFALIVAARYGPGLVPIALFAALVATLMLLAGARTPAIARDPGTGAFAGTLRAVLAWPVTWLGVAFALIGGAGFEAVGAVVGPFLVDRGESTEAIGKFLALPAIAATIGGGSAGAGSRTGSVARAWRWSGW